MIFKYERRITVKDFRNAKKIYEKPELTILEFESEDIITTSGGTLDTADISGSSETFISSWFGQ